jgi:hypothetical protein
VGAAAVNENDAEAASSILALARTRLTQRRPASSGASATSRGPERILLGEVQTRGPEQILPSEVQTRPPLGAVPRALLQVAHT